MTPKGPEFDRGTLDHMARAAGELRAENADLRSALLRAEDRREEGDGLVADLRSKLKAAEAEAERIMAANDVPEMYGAGQRRAAERILTVLLEPANAGADLCVDCLHPWIAHDSRGCGIDSFLDGPCSCTRTGPPANAEGIASTEGEQ